MDKILHDPLRYTCATVGNRAPHTPRISMLRAHMGDAGFRSFTHALSKRCKDSNVKIQGLEGMTCVIKVMQDFVHQQYQNTPP